MQDVMISLNSVLSDVKKRARQWDTPQSRDKVETISLHEARWK